MSVISFDLAQRVRLLSAVVKHCGTAGPSSANWEHAVAAMINLLEAGSKLEVSEPLNMSTLQWMPINKEQLQVTQLGELIAIVQTGLGSTQLSNPEGLHGGVLMLQNRAILAEELIVRSLRYVQFRLGDVFLFSPLNNLTSNCICKITVFASIGG
jgi:hypothetical protein